MAFDTYTKLVSHFNGIDGATTSTAATGQIITFAGTAQLDTAQSKFGGASLFLDGNSDYVTVPDSDDWFLGTGAFTIDFWVRFNSVAASQILMTQGTGGNNNWFIQWTTGNILSIGNYDSGWTIQYQCSWTPSANTWYHLAFVRISATDATTHRIFIDGTAQSLVLNNGAWTGNFSNYAATLGIGDNIQGQYMNGWLDEVRISKGIARWTSNFTPPTGEYRGSGGTQTIII